MGDRRPVILALTLDVQQLSRLAGTGAEVAVVEQEHAEAGRVEAFRVSVEALLANGREAMGHDEQRGGSGSLAAGRARPRSRRHPRRR